MLCACGRNLGNVTRKTKGLCVECGRSKWLQYAWRYPLDAVRICSELNEKNAKYCLCQTTAVMHVDCPGLPPSYPYKQKLSWPFPCKTWCFSTCGVFRITLHSRSLEPRYRWLPISNERRDCWFQNMLEKNREAQYGT